MNNQRSVSSLTIQILLMAMITSSFATTDFYLPSLPAITEYFHISTQNAQFTITIFLFSISVMPLIYGPLSDYFGRKNILIVGYFIFIIGSLLCTIAQTFSLLLVGRFLQGVGVCAATVLTRVILKDCYTGTELAKNTGKLALGTTMALAISPMIGGFIQQYFGFRTSFGLLFLSGFLLAFLIYFYLPETNPFKKSRPLNLVSIIRDYIFIIKNQTFIGYALTSGLAMSAIIACSIINPFLMQVTLHASPQLFGILTLLISTGFIVGANINIRLVGRFGINKMILFGSVVLFVSGMILLLSGFLNYLNLFVLVLANFVAAIATSFVFPNAVSGSLSLFSNIVGAAGAVYGCIQALVSTQASNVLSYFNTDSQIPLGWAYIVLAIATFVVIVLLSRTKEEQQMQLQPVNEYE